MTALETQFLDRFPGVTFAIAAAELAREAEARRRVDAEKIRKGRMSPAEAEERQAILAAIGADLDRVRAVFPCLPHPGRTPADNVGAPPPHAYTWRDRDRALLAELALRRKFYPEWIRERGLDQAEADRRIRVLEAIHALYEKGLDWPADPEIREAMTYGICQRRDPNWIDLAATGDTAPYHRAKLAHAAELGLIPAQQEYLFA